MQKQSIPSSKVKQPVRRLLSFLVALAMINAGATTAPAAPVFPEYNATDITKAEEGATTDQATIQNAYGTTSAMKQNAINPFVGTNQDLHTIDGSQHSNVAMPTAASNAFVTVAASAANADGDIPSIAVTQDLLDGSATRVMATPAAPFGVVSGVCANGVISCAPGTFTNCNYYLWDAPGGVIQLTQATLQDMSGCYGINNASGSSPSIINLDTIVRDLGAGAVASVLKYNPKYTISGTDASIGKISYYGRLTTSTSSVPGYSPGTTLTTTSSPLTKTSTWDGGQSLSAPTMSGTQTPGKYSFDASNLSTDATNEYDAQNSNANSYLSLLKNSTPATNQQTHTVQCTMSNDVVINSAQNYCDDPTPPTMLREMQTTQYYRVHEEQITVGGDSSKNRPVPPIYPAGFDPSLVIAPQDVTASELQSIPHAYIYPSTGELVLQGVYDSWNCDYGFFGVGSSTCHHSDWYQYYSQCTRTYDNQVTQQVNSTPSCSSLDTTDGCTITDEVVDGVVTMQGGVHNFQPPSGCYKTVLSPAGVTYKIPLPWCQKTRTYSCKNTAVQFDLSGVNRMNTASSTVQLSTSGGNYQMTYEDAKQNADGSWNSTARSAALSTVKATDSCEKMCKISRPSTNTQVGMNGTANSALVDVATTDTIYSACSPDCKTQPGDTIIQDCACLDTFSDAIVAISILQQAKTDATCSSTP